VNYSGGCEEENGRGFLGQANYLKDGCWKGIVSNHSRIRAAYRILLSTVHPRWGFTVKATVSKLARTFKNGDSG